MYSDTLSNLPGAPIFPIIGLVLFVAAFVGVVIRVVRMDRKDIDTLSRLPLDDKTETPIGDSRNE